MRAGFAVALLLAVSLPVSALADNIVSVDLTGELPNGTPLTSMFTLNLNTSSNDGFIYTFTDPSATVDGSADALTVNISESFDGDTVEIMDGSSLDEYIDFAADGVTPLLDTSIPALNPGTYSGFDFACSAKNEAPGQALPSTLAMLQMPGTPCLFQLVATSATPEPTSLALFATGLLGVGGIVRRRYFA